MTTPTSHPAPSATPQTRRREILETAARLICANGYDATSIQAIADACRLTKPGLYHYIGSKENLLVEIMNYGMDVFEAEVLAKVEGIADPVERLERCMERNIRLVTQARSKEVTVILHEHATLTGEALAQINARKKRYVRFLEEAFGEAMLAGRMRPVHPAVAAFSFLGMVLWIYKWFRADGAVPEERLVREMKEVFFRGMLVAPEGEA